MIDAARVHRTSFDDGLPWLAGLHTPAEDEAFFAGPVFDACRMWGTFADNRLVGFVALRAGWIDHLYVLPAEQGRGAGTSLLSLAQNLYPQLELWTFQRNLTAIRFYERHGFAAVEHTDGSRNEEREPDVRLKWPAP